MPNLLAFMFGNNASFIYVKQCKIITYIFDCCEYSIIVMGGGGLSGRMHEVNHMVNI